MFILLLQDVQAHHQQEVVQVFCPLEPDALQRRDPLLLVSGPLLRNTFEHETERVGNSRGT